MLVSPHARQLIDQTPMSSGLAFHIAARALNLDRAFSPRHLFADSVRHVIDGHVAAGRYYQISTDSSAVALNESALERRMRQLFALDLNPLICMTRQLDSELALFKAWNTYQEHVSLAVRTIIHGNANDSYGVNRRQMSYAVDPPAARNAGLCAIDILSSAARSNREHGPVAGDQVKWRLSGIAAELGLQHTVVFEAALYFEENRGRNVAKLSRTLGCHSRTLQRHFKDFGLTARDIRMASALAGATNSLWGTASLTEIALEHGFSDQAHMTRAFRHACGLPPSVLRGLVNH
jgi:AraC-like DNA-binding protein